MGAHITPHPSYLRGMEGQGGEGRTGEGREREGKGRGWRGKEERGQRGEERGELSPALAV